MNHPHPPIGLAALLLVTTLIAGAASGPGLPTVAGTAATLRDSGQRLGGADTYGTEVVLGDVDRDGDIDAVVVGPGIPTRCWLNDGAGRFSDSGRDLGGNALGVALADLGVDGLPELISLHDESGGTVRVWVNTGAGTFRRRIERQVGGDLPSALQVGPLGGDSRADVLVVREGAGANVVWNSRSILEMATRLPGPWQPQSNAASPHALDLRSDSQRYYRLRQVPGR